MKASILGDGSFHAIHSTAIPEEELGHYVNSTEFDVRRQVLSDPQTLLVTDEAVKVSGGEEVRQLKDVGSKPDVGDIVLLDERRTDLISWYGKKFGKVRKEFNEYETEKDLVLGRILEPETSDDTLEDLQSHLDIEKPPESHSEPSDSKIRRERSLDMVSSLSSAL